MSVKKQADGRWSSYLRYHDGLGRIRQKRKTTFRTKKEAQQWERNFLASHEGQVVPDLTLADLAERYFRDQQPRWKPQTYIQLSGTYRNHILPVLGHLMLNKITVRVVMEFQTQLLQSETLTTYRSRQSVNTLLSQLMNYAVKYYGLPQNPVTLSPFDGNNKMENERQHNVWTKEQFTDFLHRIPDGKDSVYAYKLYYTILYYAGLRRGEGMALMPGDFDFTRNTVSITKTRDKTIGSPKTPSSRRVITLPRHLMLRIQNYISHIYGASDEILLFNKCSSAYDRRWTTWQQKYGEGLPYVRVHDLRHSHASLLMHMRYVPQAVSDRLGHRDPTMLMKIYGHAYEDDQQEIADGLDALMTKPVQLGQARKDD